MVGSKRQAIGGEDMRRAPLRILGKVDIDAAIAEEEADTAVGPTGEEE